MHHKKIRTSGKMWIKRIDHKKLRQAEEQALRGDHVRTVRRHDWGKSEQAPIPDDAPIPQRKKQGKKRKPKDRCPVHPSGKHGYLKDIEIITVEHQPWYWNGYYHGGYIHKYEHRFKLCVYCGKEKTLRRRHLRNA